MSMSKKLEIIAKKLSGKGKDMTLEDAIKHLEEVIPQMECSDCKEEHIKLLRWLRELSELKKQ